MAIVISLILLFIGIGVLILIHVCIVGRTLRRGLMANNFNRVERGSFGSTSMSQDDIEKLPCFDFKAKEGKGTSPAADCAVCLENFRVGEKCRLLPSCNHSFHAECVDLWLLRAPICPICRAGADGMKSGSLCGEESENHELRVGQTMGTSLGNEGGVIEISGMQGQIGNFNRGGGDVLESQTGN
ncbi:RING-H2 finger protein atl52 [Phtheirospermum japonicum]|uniref:RING-H2 finger protein atl52 n=1 Tax=Phtheirospermum japonicum TaxID=374723 RepID=A0A830CK62_9LAMI|nr:RING-H2 finger protein atl52 [Phtheirospermum japonicum]